ncbi:MAG: aminotransferase class I/II-fold pyridoxal phosphate-dependent enzyme [Actinomycetes bacterium]
MRVPHGGTDAGPPPRVDASTNANPLGPSPAARAALAAVDLGPYPDPDATAVRAALAVHHGLDPDGVVVGAGATELVDRLVRVVGGPVLTEAETFGEYAGAAARHGYGVVRADGPEAFLAALDDAAVAFVPSPGSPDGRVRDAAWCDAVAERAAATGTVLVWDLAYAPLADVPVPLPAGAVALHAPNKAHGCTGIRAGWLAAPAALAGRLRDAEVTWVTSALGLAFLAATATPDADAWVAGCLPTLRAWRDHLAAGLTDLGLAVAPSDAPFVTVDVGDDAPAVAARLRERHGVKVRDTTSMGRPGAWRVAARPPEEMNLLLAAVATELDTAREVRACVR